LVTGEYINGLGGDPAIHYRYTVAGRSYTGDAVNGWDYHGTLNHPIRSRSPMTQTIPASRACA